MNLTEATAIMRQVAALCPHQKIDLQYGPQAWLAALSEHTLTDANHALKQLAQQPLEPGKTLYIHPSNIIWQIEQNHHKKLAAAGWPDRITPPDHIDQAGHHAYQQWLDQTRRSILNGTYKSINQ